MVYDEVGEDGKNLTTLCKLPIDKIIVACGCIWAVAKKKKPTYGIKA